MHRLLFLLLFLHVLESGKAQKTLQSPLICHDKNNFLRYYDDGTYIFKFNQGEFVSFKTSDSALFYDNATTKITFITSSSFPRLKSDTISIYL
jgi:hypothetical protein